MGRIRDWWRSRGHGIHSPFAFRIVTTVLRERGRYYAYDVIDRHPDAAWYKLLFRLICEFEPRRVGGILSDNERKVIRMADSRVEFVADGADFIVADEVTYPVETVTVVRDLSAMDWERAKHEITDGMTFTNGKVGLIVPRASLPRQDFRSRF